MYNIIWNISTIKILSRKGLSDREQSTAVFGHTIGILNFLLESMMSTKNQAFFMPIGVGVYSSQEEFASERARRGYMLR